MTETLPPEGCAGPADGRRALASRVMRSSSRARLARFSAPGPTDRRQLTGSRRRHEIPRAAARRCQIKLEAAQQNLPRRRHVFEVGKQRGRRSARRPKARATAACVKSCGDGRSAVLAAVSSARRGHRRGADEAGRCARLGSARRRPPVRDRNCRRSAASRAQPQADAAETEARELAHARELAIGRLQQQVTFDRHQVETLGASAAGIEAEVASLEGRRDRHGSSSRSAAPPKPSQSPNGIRPLPISPPRRTPTLTCRSASRASKATSRRRAARSSPR